MWRDDTARWSVFEVEIRLKILSWLLLACCLGTGAALAEVEIEAPGAPPGLLDNLRARLALADEPCDAPRWRVQRRYARVESELDPALRAFGYYSASVEKHLERDTDCWHATLTVTLGEPVRVRQRSIQVNGAAHDDPALHTLLDQMPLPVGAPLRHAEYESIKARLREFAGERGYLDWRFERQVLRVDPAAGAVDIELLAESGPRYRFGDIHISEQPLDEELIRRIAGLDAGEDYDARSLTGLDRRLSDSGYFSRVDVRPRRDEANDGTVPVDVLLQPAKRHAWRAGVGYATDTGARASLRYDNRYMNRRGHRLESALSLSPVLSTLLTDYVVPGLDPQRESYSFGAQLKHEETGSTESESATLVARHTLQEDNWIQNRFVEFLHEQSLIGDEQSDANLLMPGIGFTRTEADDLLRTRRGYRVGFEARAAHEALLSTATFVQLSARAKGIYRFGDAGRISARAELGVTLLNDLEQLPASLRYFAGGDNSVRGYAYKSLGPRDSSNDPEGGNNLLTLSAEYEHPVRGEDWWLAAFADVGNAFNGTRAQLARSVGGGLRWYSPIGRLRLDIAFPHDPGAGVDSWRLHFGLGADL